MIPIQSTACIELTFAFKATHLRGKPHEYEPRLAIWSTDRDRMPDANPGMGAQFVALKPDAERPGWLKSTARINLPGPLPIATDPLSELCIVVQAKTLSDGHEVKAELAARPYHIRVGQVNVQWYGMLAHLHRHKISHVKLTAPVETLCGFESVVAEHHFEHDTEDKARLYLKQAEKEATRGKLEISCRSTLSHDELDDHVRTAAYACPGGMDPSEYVESCAKAYSGAIKDYVGIYDTMFPEDQGRPFVRAPESTDRRR